MTPNYSIRERRFTDDEPECTATGEAAALSLLQEAVDAWPQMDHPDDDEGEINGGDMVEWFGFFHAKALDVLKGSPVATAAALVKLEDIERLAVHLSAKGHTEQTIASTLALHALTIIVGDIFGKELAGHFQHNTLQAVDKLLRSAGIDALAETVSVLSAPAEKGFTIVIEGGAVNHVVTHDPALIGMPYWIVDYDTDGADMDNAYLRMVKQGGGDFALAYCSDHAVSAAEIEHPSISELATRDDLEG